MTAVTGQFAKGRIKCSTKCKH